MKTITKQTPEYIKMRILDKLIKRWMTRESAVKKIKENFDFAYRHYWDCYRTMIDCIISV